jgi:hypothetical protein
VRAAVALTGLLAALALAGDTVRTEAVGLRFAVPAGWMRTPAASDVRAAQWRVPATGPDEDGEVVLFYFGRGKGGGTEENLQRWYAQFTEPDGRTAHDAAVLTVRTVNGLRVSEVDLTGTYQPPPMMGGGPPRPGTRLLAAIVEGGDGPWFFKALGPAATMERAKPGFDAMLASLEPHR